LYEASGKQASFNLEVFDDQWQRYNGGLYAVFASIGIAVPGQVV
jgi:hypothetical protein